MVTFLEDSKVFFTLYHAGKVNITLHVVSLSFLFYGLTVKSVSLVLIGLFIFDENKSMKRLTITKSFRLGGLSIAVFAVLTFSMQLAAFGQQEVDPTWHDPWAKPAKVVVQPSKPPISRPPAHKTKRKSTSASPHQPSKEARGTRHFRVCADRLPAR